MKKSYRIAALCAASAMVAATAGNIVWVRGISGVNNGVDPELVKSITYGDGYANVVVEAIDGTVLSTPVAELDGLTFGEVDGTAIDITQADGKLSVNNPLAMNGVSASAVGDKVTITANSGSKVNINVTDVTTTDGQIKIYGSDKVTLTIKNVSITNQSGSAINFQTSEAPTLTVTGENTLTDSEEYDTPEGEKENGTVYSLKKLTLSGKGTLVVRGNCKHAIASNKKVVIDGATILVTHAASDGVHGDGIEMISGSVNTAGVLGDGMDADKGKLTISGGKIDCIVAADDTKGLKADGDITVDGGDITLNVTGNQSKGIRTKANMTVNDGKFNITTSGNAVVVDNDPSYCTAIKVDSAYVQNGGTIIINTSGIGGKGISVDSAATFNGGHVEIKCTGNGATYTTASNTNDAYSSTCITIDGNLAINGGEFILNNSGSAGKCIKCDSDMTLGTANGGPTIEAHATGVRIQESSGSSGGGWGRPGGGFDNNADYSNPKCIKADGNLVVNGGSYTLTTSNQGGEGMESKKALTINGGDINIAAYDDGINAATSIVVNGGVVRSLASNNDGIDSNGTIRINGGVVIAGGASAPECGFDCDNNQFAVTGGILVGFGGDTSSPTASACTQRCVIFSATASNGTLVTIVDPNGAQVVSFKMPKSINSPKFLMSAPGITTGTHKIYTGGTVTGGQQYYEVTTGGTFTGGTQATTFSPTSMVTNISSGGSRPR